MLSQVCSSSTSFYALLDRGSTLSFVTPLLAPTFEIFHEVLHDTLVVRTPFRRKCKN